MSTDLSAVDELFAKRFEEGLTPALAYAVVRHGEIVHEGAFGTTRLDPERRPDADSVFRIASMSKSFIASAILLLRDRGLVDLDEAVAQYLPELVDQPPYSPDSPAVTLRLLLTMAGGLPSDNPWGDRQESLSYDAFGTFLDGGFAVGREPGTFFEYSNVGYALLGRVVANVTGADAPEGAERAFVEAELLGPLGMTATAYDVATVGPALVPGHVRRGGAWVELPPTPPGAFSAMGGLHSTLRDLATWVGGFTSAFDAKADAHPLSKASRRELQQLQRIEAVTGTLSVDGPEPGVGAVAAGYGFGLMVDHDARLGQIVHHSGGYPGYGSRMVWHPDTGVGVVTLSNATYAGAYDQAMTATRLLARAELDAGGPTRWSTVVRGLRPRVDAALAAAIERLRAFDPEGGESFADPRLFADNVELDVPDDERRTQLGAARDRVGLPLGGAPYGYWSRTMGHAFAVVPAERGRYDVDLLLSPEAEPRIQSLRAVAVTDATADVLAAAREALAADTPVAAAMRAFGDPELIEAPLADEPGRPTELLVVAGPTYWKLLVGQDVTLTAHPTSEHDRLGYLTHALR
ncbi:serine hydrolase domain-containing protein [Nocardioides sp. KR10-350]|uniref:serine hydrolase domain-containing protein n=1 Tax=Nocardioides cheoyonin TaxID=3156615 RepID=UPI0032B4F2DB